MSIASTPALTEQITRQKVIAIIRTGDPETALAQAVAVLDAGLLSVEVTFTTPDAMAVVRQLVRDYPTATVGAGTVLDVGQARAAIDGGARFLVSPHVADDVVAVGVEAGIACFPGAATATEILRAHRAGAAAVKLFPASAFGPSYLREIHAPLPQVPLIPTGGITVAAVPDWLAAGALAVGLGSGLTAGSSAEIRDRVAGLLTSLG